MSYTTPFSGRKLALTLVTTLECYYGMGSHSWTIPQETLVLQIRASPQFPPASFTADQGNQAAWVGSVFYQLSLFLTKVSILLLYIRILKYQFASWAAWSMLIVVVVYNIWVFVLMMTICVPLPAFWDRTIQGDCKPYTSMWASIGLHITTDFLIFFIPLPVVYKMTLPWQKRLGLALLFALGFL